MWEKRPATGGHSGPAAQPDADGVSLAPSRLLPRHTAKVESMFGPVVILAAFLGLLALCGLLSHHYGWDSRDGFADQVRHPRGG